jgi:hypothetical protein
MGLPHSQHGASLAVHLRLNVARSSLYRLVERPAYLLVDVTDDDVLAHYRLR